MKEYNKNATQFYTFKIYTPFEVITLFLLFLTCFMGLGYWFNLHLLLKNWNDEVLKGLVLAIFLFSFFIAQYKSSVEVTTKIDSNGLVFMSFWSVFGFSKNEKILLWTDIKEWYLTESHASAHGFSPSIFTIVLKNGKKQRFYILDHVKNWAIFNEFMDFLRKESYRRNIYDTTTERLTKLGNTERSSKIFAGLLAFLLISMPFLAVWFSWFSPYKNKSFDSKNIPLSDLLSLCLITVFVWTIAFFIIKRQFFFKK